MKEENKGYNQIIFAGILASIIPLMVRSINNLDSYSIAFFRVFLAALFLGAFFLLYKKKLVLLKYEIKKMVFFGFLHGFILFGYFFAVKQLTIASAVFLMYSFPAWIVLFSIVLLKEKPTKWELYGLIVSFIGIFIIFSPELSKNLFALFVGLGAGVAAGLTYTLSKTFRKYDKISLIFWQNVLAIPFVSALFLLNFPEFRNVTLLEIFFILFIGLISVFTFILVFRALEKTKANKAGALMVLEVLWPIFFAFLVFDEVPSFRVIFGGIVIIFGAYLAAGGFYRSLFFSFDSRGHKKWGDILQKDRLSFNSQNELKNYYEQKYRKGGYKKGFEIFEKKISNIYHKNRHEVALELIELNKNDFVLDAGCGRGELTRIIAKKSKKVIGLDVSNYAIKLAKKNCPKNCKFKEENIEKMKFQDEHFDKIMCIETLQNVLKPENVLKELRRVLKNRGRVVVSVSLMNNTIISKIEKIFGIHKKILVSEHLHEWNYSSIIKFFSENGFKVIKSKGVVFSFGRLWDLFSRNRLLRDVADKVSLSIRCFPRNSDFAVFLLEKDNIRGC
jgi:drug/metabolite transporter (DMT)-like permease/ubiquinone/menaquinone biosynthesis C-methylase UbiE